MTNGNGDPGEEDELIPSGAGITIERSNVRQLFRAVQKMVERLDYTERDPSMQLGKYWLTSEERLLLRGSGRSNSLDGFTDEMTMRSTTNGSRMDQEMAHGFILMVPTRGGALRQPTSFAMMVNERSATPQAQTQPEQPQTAVEDPPRPQNQRNQPRPFANRLEWDSPYDEDDTILKRLRSDAARTQATEQGWVEELDEFLNNPDALRNIGIAYGGSVSTRWPKPVWARSDRGFDLDRAIRGEAIWHFSRNFPGRKLHEYDPMMAPSKSYLNQKTEEYFNQLPAALRSELLIQMAETKRPGQAVHRFGRGPWRHHSYGEITPLPTDTQAEREEKEANRAQAVRSWRLRWHLLRARDYGYYHYIEEYKTSVLEHRRYLQDRAGRDTFTVGDRRVALTETGPSRLNDAEFESIWLAPDVTQNPNQHPNQRADNGYLGYHVQMPPSMQYAFWKRTESKIRYADERDGAFDGQTESERIYAYYLVQRMFTWWEHLPRIDNRGIAHYKWYTHPDHNSDKCNGCAHFDADVSKSNWIPAEGPFTNHPDGWVYEEELIWHPTRQAIQLLRKIMYTHNVGSHLTDIFADLIMSPTDAKAFRAGYGGGGNERVDPWEWWWPGASRSDTLDTEDPQQVAVYQASGMVARDFWLGPINEFIETERSRPYNGLWLQHFLFVAELNESLSTLLELLRQNRTSLGIDRDDVSKKLVDIQDFDDAIVFPTEFKTVGQDVQVIFDEKRPQIMPYHSIAGHVDPYWFIGGRSLYATDTTDKIIEEYERVYQDWMRPGTHEFRDGLVYILTWPNGRQSRVTSFREEDFYKYLRVYWTQPQALARHFWENQDAEGFSVNLRNILNREVANGNFNGLRKVINKYMDGLPIRSWDPNQLDADGNSTRQVNRFGELRAWAYEYADNQWWRYLMLKSKERGVIWGDVTSYVLDGGGQGYGPLDDQLKRIWKYYEIPLKNIYFDTWKGIVEAHHLLTRSGANTGVEAWDDAFNDLAAAVKARKLNWTFVREAADTMPTFFGMMHIGDWIHDRIPEESEELEQTWLNHIAIISAEQNPHGAVLYVNEIHKLLNVPVEPKTLQEMYERTLTAA